MEFESILYESAGTHGGVATIRLNRPEKYNALNHSVNQDMLQALNSVAQDETARVLILTGTGRAFAAGADVGEMAVGNPRGVRSFRGAGCEVAGRMEALDIPVIAALNGPALGGGLEYALACDFRVVGPKSKLGLPEIGLGIIPGGGGTQRLLALAGLQTAREMVLLGQSVSGREAMTLGLADRYAEDGDVYAAALELADELMTRPKLALAAAKRVLNVGAYQTAQAGWMAEESEFLLLFDTYDQKEGMRAMLEKRQPSFRHC